MSLSLLSLVSCGKAAKSTADKLAKDIGNKLGCDGATALSVIPQALAPDYDIKMYQETVAKVLAEIRPHKTLEPKDFWSTLSNETRDELNYELNIMLTKKDHLNPLAVYQSTAYFFTNVRDFFKDNTTYKLRDAGGAIFSFEIRAQKTFGTVLLNFNCGRHERTDLSAIKIGPKILQASEISEIYECRTENRSMMLMEVRDTMFLSAGNSLYRLPLKYVKKDDKKRKLGLKFNSVDVKFDLSIKKKRNEALNGWNGKKAKIELSIPDYSIDDDGACNTLKHAFES